MDIAFLPFFRILLFTAAKSIFGILDENDRSTIYIHSEEDLPPQSVRVAPICQKEIENAQSTVTARTHRIHQKATLKAFLKVSLTIIVTASYCIISESILPKEKYFGERNFRIRLPEDTLWTIPAIWNLLTNQLTEINFRREGKFEKLSENDELYGHDRINFRLGPARIFQFREVCGNFRENWKNLTEAPAAYEFDSPLARPWFVDNSTTVPGNELKIEAYRSNIQILVKHKFI